jgi:hypothetical protein
VCVDFDIRGSIGVRVLDGSESDVAAVGRQLGPRSGPLARSPDVVVRFVERLPLKGATLVTARDSAFTEDGFLILRCGLSARHAQIALWELGGPCEIVCESGCRSVPLLLEAVKLASLRKGLIPLPASAFEYEGVGMLVAGGAHAGKTSSLLAFVREGALYVGDDLVFVRSDGREAFSLGTPITLATGQIDELPHGGRAIPAIDRKRLALYERLEAVRRWASEGAPAGSLRDRLSATVEAPLRDRLTLECTPAVLFGDAVLPSTEPRQVFLTLGHDASDVRVKGITSEEFIDRVANLLQAEDLSLLGHHLDYRTAALGQSHAFIDRADELRRSLLELAFSDKETFVVRRPRSASPEAVFRAMVRVRGDGHRGRTDFGVPGDQKSWRSKAGRGKTRRSTRG